MGFSFVSVGRGYSFAPLVSQYSTPVSRWQGERSSVFRQHGSGRLPGQEEFRDPLSCASEGERRKKQNEPPFRSIKVLGTKELAGPICLTGIIQAITGAKTIQGFGTEPFPYPSANTQGFWKKRPKGQGHTGRTGPDCAEASGRHAASVPANEFKGEAQQSRRDKSDPIFQTELQRLLPIRQIRYQFLGAETGELSVKPAVIRICRDRARYLGELSVKLQDGFAVSKKAAVELSGREEQFPFGGFVHRRSSPFLTHLWEYITGPKGLCGLQNDDLTLMLYRDSLLW